MKLILVHGTWGKNSSFGLPEQSRLASCIRERFGSAVQIERFAWSGKNTQAQRTVAAADLRKKLQEALQAHKGGRTILACHSHGGNIAQKACEGLGGEIVIISLGTPYFELVKNRRGLEARALVLFGSSVIVGFISWLCIFFAGYLDFISLALITTVYCWLYGYVLKRAPWEVSQFPGIDRIHARLESLYAAMPLERHTLAVYTHRDEVAGFVWFWDWVCYALSLAAVLPLIWVVVPPTWTWLTNFASTHLIEGSGNRQVDPGEFLLVIPELLMTLAMVLGGLLAVSLAALAIAFLASSLCATGIKWLAKIPTSGIESFAMPLAFDVVVRYLPAGDRVEGRRIPYLKWWRKSFWPLVHSKLYDDPEVLSAVCDWIGKLDTPNQPDLATTLKF